MAEKSRIPTTQTGAEIVPALGDLPVLPQGDLPEGLATYLKQLGLNGTHQAKVMALVQATEEEEPATFVPPVPPEVMEEEEPRGEFAKASGRPASLATDLVRLYVAEEQLILKNAYQSFFTDEPSINLMGATNDTSTASLVEAVEEHQPHVLLVGVKALKADLVERLKIVKDVSPDVAIVLLFAFYDAQGIKALRGYSQGSSLGRAYLLKHTIDTVDQLIQVVCSVAQGRIIVDPVVMEALVSTGDNRSGYLRELSPKALEVLSWMAKGYRNDTIAQVLSRDVRTVERHINSIYSKLEIDDASRDPRVNAALKYLQATGSLPKEPDYED